MNNVIVTLILVLITVSLAASLIGYYSSLGIETENTIMPLQTAMELSKEIYISYSPPVISYIIPTEPNTPLNLSVRSLVTLNLNFSGTLYVVPFLMKNNYVPYNYIPEGYYGGYINQISNPDDIGYVSVSGSGVINEVRFQNTQVNLLTRSIAGISFYAFEVKPNSVLNVSFTTNTSYVPVLWILANISGQMFRIAYPVIEAQQYVNTYLGSITSPMVSSAKDPNYSQPFEQYLGNYSLLFEGYPNSEILFCGYGEVYTPDGYIGYNHNGSGRLNIETWWKNQIIAKHLYYSPNTKIYTSGYNLLPPNSSSNDIPNVSVTNLVNLFYEQYNPYQYQIQLEHEANQLYNQYKGQFQTNSTSSISVSKPITINTPTIFTNSVVFTTSAGGKSSEITFNAPVIFECSVTDYGVNLTFNSLVIFKNKFTISAPVSITFNNIGVFEGSFCINYDLNMMAKDGLLFNSSMPGTYLDFWANSINIVSNGPVIINLTSPYFSGVSFSYSGKTIIYQNSPILSISTNFIGFYGNIIVYSKYPLLVHVNNNDEVQIANANITVQGSMVITGGVGSYLNEYGWACINIINGDLIINTSYNILFEDYPTIHVNGLIAMQSGYICFSELDNMTAVGSIIFHSVYGVYFRFWYFIFIKSLNNSVNGLSSEHILSLGLNSINPLYITGWFGVIPNNAPTSVINVSLTNGTYMANISLDLKPVTPTEYKVALYVNNTLIGCSSSILSDSNKYMYVIEGYVSGSKTYLELTIYNSTSVSIVELVKPIPLPLNTGVNVEIGSEPNYQFMIYSGTSSLVNVMLTNGAFVNITNQLKNNLPNGVSHLYYYYLIAPPTDLQFKLEPTYYYPGNADVLYLEVMDNSLA